MGGNGWAGCGGDGVGAVWCSAMCAVSQCALLLLCVARCSGCQHTRGCVWFSLHPKLQDHVFHCQPATIRHSHLVDATCMHVWAAHFIFVYHASLRDVNVCHACLWCHTHVIGEYARLCSAHACVLKMCALRLRLSWQRSVRGRPGTRRSRVRRLRRRRPSWRPWRRLARRRCVRLGDAALMRMRCVARRVVHAVAKEVGGVCGLGLTAGLALGGVLLLVGLR